jgi:tRNA(adenine34) deaminase
MNDHDLEHERHMRLALALARDARLAGEVPVGAVVVSADGDVIGRGCNASIGRTDPTAHAEVPALRDAALRTGNYRAPGATLYSTIEPCLMCLGAMLHARIGLLVYGAADARVGATDKLQRLRDVGADFNHRFEVRGGLLGQEAGELLLDFFRERRERQRIDLVEASALGQGQG